jgi:hypothetical protein
MARFWISVHGDDLWRAMMLLNGASIPTIGSFPAYRGDQPPPDWQLDRLTAAVDAKTEQDAMANVSAVLPDGYEIDRRELD